ncbi:MAG: hypothetical protein QMC95_03295 [Desulfitobacteriaceae bacterium]|nr:hypothetical protein [Desulfitobacteriaceae bacterium]MDI6879587.1 hypothetical protein [Desulfitobacteriaceae bacterium]MDI6913228.1 hypothetical protein [Desulfitobacteriaceae bacterium]
MTESHILTDYEQALKQIRSVSAARIRMTEQGEIEEIHILAGGERSAKQIVRDVESVLVAQFGLEFDHKKISVAQVGEEVLVPPIPEWVRPKLIGVTLKTLHGTADVTVELQVGERVIAGATQGFSSSYNKLRLLVEATVKALNSLELEKCLLVPEDVAVTELAKHKVAQVAVTLVCPAGEQLLVGCALVKNDDREAVVKATLDAVNRKVRVLTE